MGKFITVTITNLWNSLELALLLLCFPPIFVEAATCNGFPPEMHVKPVIVQPTTENTIHRTSYTESSRAIKFCMHLLRKTCCEKENPHATTLYIICLALTYYSTLTAADTATFFQTSAPMVRTHGVLVGRSFSNTCHYCVASSAEKH